ncbi:MAG: hypothetical protein IJ365_07170, partial [Clostridia bacterium]|nr:hypothetical protein [Clostridia bacterium]
AGLFGKTDDEIVAAETRSNGSKLTTTVSFDDNYSFSNNQYDYAVLDLNFAPTTDWQSAICGPDAGIATITQSFGDGVIKNNRWNNVRIVVKEKTAEDIVKDNYYQPMRMYINGKEIEGDVGTIVKLDDDGYKFRLHTSDYLHPEATNPTGYFAKGFRFTLVAPSGGSATAYVTDVKKYGSDGIGAPVMPAIESISGVYTVDQSSGLISGEKAVTVGDITADGYSVRIYEDSTMETIIDNSSAILREGNVIVVADDTNKLYSYYTYGNKNMLYEFTEGTITQTVSNGKKSVYTDGIGGKSDPVMKIARTADAVGSKETYFDIVYDADRSDGTYESDMSKADFMTKDTAKYVVLEMDYYPTDAANRFSIAGHQSVELTATSNYISKLNKNQWNKIALVVSNNCDDSNPSPGETTYTSYSALPSNIHTYQLFINGTLAEEGSMKKFGYHWKNTSDRRECFFRIALASTTDAACDVYLDNIKLYDTNTVDCTEYAEIYGRITDNGVEFSTAKTEGTMLVAAYDTYGNLVGDVSLKKLGSGVNTVSIDAVSGAASYTAYIWKNLSTIAPLCDKVQLSVQ